MKKGIYKSVSLTEEEKMEHAILVCSFFRSTFKRLPVTITELTIITGLTSHAFTDLSRNFSVKTLALLSLGMMEVSERSIRITRLLALARTAIHTRQSLVIRLADDTDTLRQGEHVLIGPAKRRRKRG